MIAAQAIPDCDVAPAQHQAQTAPSVVVPSSRTLSLQPVHLPRMASPVPTGHGQVESGQPAFGDVHISARAAMRGAVSSDERHIAGVSMRTAPPSDVPPCATNVGAPFVDLTFEDPP